MQPKNIVIKGKGAMLSPKGGEQAKLTPISPQQVEELRHKIEYLDKKVSELTKENEQLSSQLQRRDSTPFNISETSADMIDNDEQRQRDRRELAQLIDEKNKLESQIDQLNNKMKAAEAKQASSTKILADIQQQVAMLTNQLSESHQERRRLEESNNEIVKQLRERQDELAQRLAMSQQSSVQVEKKLKDQNAALEKQLADLKKKGEISAQQVDRLKNKLNASITENAAINKELNEAKAENKDMEVRLRAKDDIELQLRNKQEEVQQLRKQLLKKPNVSVSEEIQAELTTQRSFLLRSVGSYREERLELLQIVAQLRKLMQKRTKENSSPLKSSRKE